MGIFMFVCILLFFLWHRLFMIFIATEWAKLFLYTILSYG